MAFNTKRPLIDAKYSQSAGQTLTLSGDTRFGTAEYLTDKSSTYVARSVPDVAYVTGQTALKVDCTDFNSYTGATDTRLIGIETDITTISGDVAQNASDIATISGDVAQNASDITTISGDVAQNTSDIANLGAISGLSENAVTGLTNGLTKFGSNLGVLGGNLLQPTTLSGNLSSSLLIVNKATGILNYENSITNTAITNELKTEHDNGYCTTLQTLDDNVVVGWFSGVSRSSFVIDSTQMLVRDTKNTRGLLYDACYHANYTNRSLVDKEYVDNSAGALTANNGIVRQGDTLSLGGTLTGNTKVDTNGFGIAIGDGATVGGTDSVVLTSGAVTGNCSVALGGGTAGGNRALAGGNAQALGNETFAFGTGSVAIADNSSAFGGNATSCGVGSFAFGTNVTAEGANSFAFGSNGLSTGNTALSFGSGAQALGNCSIAFGSSCAIGAGTWAQGGASCAIAGQSISIGGYARTCGFGSFALGGNVTTIGAGSFALGTYTCSIGASSFAFGTGVVTKEVTASGISSINFSTNTSAQIAGHGADADYSVIIGGINHDIDGGNVGAAIIGRYGTTGIKLTGSDYVDHVAVSNLALWATPSDDNDGDVLVWDSATKKVGKSSIGALGGFSGATNGLQSINQEVALGGILTEATTVISGGNNNYSFGTAGSPMNLYNQNSSCHFVNADACAYFRTENVGGVVAIDGQNNGIVVVKSQSGAVLGDSFVNAIGFDLDFASNVFGVVDNRVGSNQKGIEYNSDYSSNYTDRSLVDKAYVDSVAAGLDAKDAVFVGTTPSDGNIDLTGGTFVSGSTLDGVVVQNGWRVLVKNQTNAVENGIWVYSASTSAFTRSDDFDGTPVGEVSNGAYTLVVSGSTLSNSQWVVTTPDPITVGTTEINWSLLSQQLGIVAGTGITVTTVNSNNTISVKLADSGSALSFNGVDALRVDSSIAGSGLTFTSGVLDVNADPSAITGTELPVHFGTNNCLYIDSDEVDAAFGTLLNSANNGLTKAGNIVSLGGDLTGNTTIDGTGANCYDFTLANIGTFSLTFDNASTITDNGLNGGIRYATDYSANFVDRSLVDKEYVDNKADSITANNGIVRQGDILSLGGTLTGDTQVDTNNFGINFGRFGIACGQNAFAAGQGNYAYGNCSVAMGYNARAYGNASFAQGLGATAYGDNAIAMGNTISAYGSGIGVGNSITVNGFTSVGMGSCVKVSGDCATAIGFASEACGEASIAMGHLNCANALYSGVFAGNCNVVNATGATIIGGDTIVMTGATYNYHTAVPNLVIDSTPTAGQFSDGVLVWDSSDKKVKQVDSTVIGGITGATNGLDVDPDKQVVLGGDLCETTYIVGNGYGLSFGASGNFADAPNAFAAGNFAYAYNNNAIAIGQGVKAYSTSSTAIGGYACANGTYAVSVGSNSYAGGNCSTTIGFCGQAYGGGSLAFCGKAYGACSIALGGTANAATSVAINGGRTDSVNSFAFGQNTRVFSSSNFGIAMGDYAKVCDTNGVAIGNAAKAYGYNSVVIGGNNTCATGTYSGAFSSNNSCSIGNYSVVLGGRFNKIYSSDSVILGGNSLNYSGATYNEHAIVPNLAIDVTPATGAFDDGVLVWDSADKKVKQVDATVIGGVTGATNGLNVVDKAVELGGALTKNTVIDGASNVYDLSFTAIDNFATEADTLDLTSTSGVDSSYLNMTGTTLVLGQTVSSNNFTIDITAGVGTITDAINSKGFVYAGDYKANFTDNSLISKLYADTEIATAIGTTITGATNGLTKVGQDATLGGDIAANTTVGLAGFSLVLGSGSTIANTVVVNNLAIEDTPDTGDAVSDAILVWDSADKKVKQVSAGQLGEDNNVYSYEGGSGTINLTTGSSYVVLVDTSIVGATINLPANPIDGQAFKIKDKSGNALTNNITLQATGDDIDGASTATLNTDYGALEVMYSSADDEWFTLSFIN